MAFPTQASPVIDDPIRPGTIWFWIGGGIIAAGVAGAIAMLVLGFTNLDDTIDDFERVGYPEGGTISIDDPGEYVVYGETLSGGTPFRTDQVEMEDPDGSPVDTPFYVSGLTYDFGGRSGVALVTFQADVAGDYEILPADDSFSGFTGLAVGDSIGDDLVRMILVPFVIGGLGFVIGAIVLIVTGVRRSREKKRRAPTAPPAPGAWGQAPQAWGPQLPSQPAQAGWGQPPPPGSQPPPPPAPSGAAPPPPPPGWPN